MLGYLKIKGDSMDSLKQVLFDKYIVPTQRKRSQKAGLEFELPIVNLEKKPVDFSLIHKMTAAFIDQFHFDQFLYDDQGNIFDAIDHQTQDSLSYDCSYNTLEFSFGPEEDLHKTHERFCEYYSFIQDYLKKYNHTLTGMGINPYAMYNEKEPIANGRYRMLFHHLQSYTKYDFEHHDYPTFGLFSCASQVQLDVEEENLVQTLNTLNRLETIIPFLFANSLLIDGLLCSRDYLWKYSLHGYNPRNVDVYEIEFKSIDDILNYIELMSIYCVDKDDKYLNFAPISLDDYFSKEWIHAEYYQDGQYHDYDFKPEYSDLKYLRSYKFNDLTFRGTIEFRSVCQQPVKEIMTPSALYAGLMENIELLDQRLQKEDIFTQHSISEIRTAMNQIQYPDWLSLDSICELWKDVLEIAKDGLLKRNKGEEEFLEPLYQRLEKRKSPARIILESDQEIEYFIKEYAKL